MTTLDRPPPGPPHLDGGAIVRRLDGEDDRDERALADAHLAECEACREALARVARRSARVSLALDLADPSDDGARPADELAARRGGNARSTPWLKAAAIAGLVAALALGSSDVRAWVASGWEAVAALLAGASEPAPGADGAADNTGDALRATFAPEPGPFLVRIARPPAAGGLTIETGTDARARLFAASEVPVLLLPRELAIDNDPGATLAVRLVLPRHAGPVIVVVGGDTLGSRDAEELRRLGTWEIRFDPVGASGLGDR